MKINRLKEIRKIRNLTENELANYLNISKSKYINYEKDINNIPITALPEICKYLNISADYILGLTNNPKPYPKKK